MVVTEQLADEVWLRYDELQRSVNKLDNVGLDKALIVFGKLLEKVTEDGSK